MVENGIGVSVLRKEDRRFLIGKGTYTDDINIAGQTYAIFVRSPHAHATINSIDTAAAAAAAPPPIPGPVPATAAPAADNGAIVDLANRVASLEATVSQGAAGIQGILAQLQELSSKVEGMMTGMQGTVGYSARQTFVCSSCQSQGHVAAKLNCTACGEDNWWGWWPPQPETPPAP